MLLSKSFAWIPLLLLAITLGVGCDKKATVSTKADVSAPSPKTPSCQQVDCKTGRIIDDGCVEIDGEMLCASCTNRCP